MKKNNRESEEKLRGEAEREEGEYKSRREKRILKRRMGQGEMENLAGGVRKITKGIRKEKECTIEG